MKPYKIVKIEENYLEYIELLLLADELIEMIHKYILDSDMYVLFVDDFPVSSIVVSIYDNDTMEIENLATIPKFQGRGYARTLINYVSDLYSAKYKYLLVGTGDSPLTVSFYEKCGFVYKYRIPNFIIDNYPTPIFEAGKQLIDKVYLEKEI